MPMVDSGPRSSVSYHNIKIVISGRDLAILYVSNKFLKGAVVFLVQNQLRHKVLNGKFV